VFEGASQLIIDNRGTHRILAGSNGHYGPSGRRGAGEMHANLTRGRDLDRDRLIRRDAQVDEGSDPIAAFVQSGKADSIARRRQIVYALLFSESQFNMGFQQDAPVV